MKLAFSQADIITTAKSLGLPTHPFYMRRTARALDLVDQNKVHCLTDEVFRVDSQYDDKHYHVDLNHGKKGCTCPDNQKNPGTLCKHMIAATLLNAVVHKDDGKADIFSLSPHKKQDEGERKSEGNSLIVKKVSNNSQYVTGRWLVIDSDGWRHVVYRERNGKRFCTCKKHYKDCIHKKAIPSPREIRNETGRDKQNPISRGELNNGGNGNGSKITNGCGSEHAKAIQDKLNGMGLASVRLNSQLDSRSTNGNGATGGFVTGQEGLSPQITNDNHQQAPEQQLEMNDPFQESELLDIAQVEGRGNGELVHRLSNGEYVISYRGIMGLAEKHDIEFSLATHVIPIPS